MASKRRELGGNSTERGNLASADLNPYLLTRISESNNIPPDTHRARLKLGVRR